MSAKELIALGEVTTLINGDRGANYPGKDEQFSEGHCLFLNTKNVLQGRFDLSETVFISKEKHEQLGGGVLQRNDIVLTIRGTLGNTAIYDEQIEADPVRINSAMIIVRPHNSLTSEYIERFLRSPNFSDWVGLNQRGSAQPHLRAEDIRTAKLPLVSKSHQRHIVTKIDSLSGKSKRARDHLDHVPRLVEKYKKAVFLAAFRGELTQDWRALNGVNEAWRIVRISEIAQIASGQTPKGIEALAGRSGSLPWYKVSSMNAEGNEHTLSSSEFMLHQKDFETLRLRVFPTGTIVFPKRGG